MILTWMRLANKINTIIFRSNSSKIASVTPFNLPKNVKMEKYLRIFAQDGPVRPFLSQADSCSNAD
ncbi:hypothetical protein T4D_3554 [Trichinella pseudospiralis]|uniref:Uncharacterized protein n=1 Tax=Trichinella pseudospiralis TaxID=6337 RepID=A0A0V1FKC5_TRIPS|nr:hypothetical protein T4D_3554 [Trichinella pseudospiralis]